MLAWLKKLFCSPAKPADVSTERVELDGWRVYRTIIRLLHCRAARPALDAGATSRAGAADAGHHPAAAEHELGAESMTLNPIRLVEEIEQLKHRLAMQKGAVDDLTRERDFWRERFDEAQRAHARLMALMMDFERQRDQERQEAAIRS